MVNYLYDCYQILNKVYSDGAYVKQAINDTVIEEKNRSVTVKTVYGVLDKDIELSYYIKKLCDKNPKLVIRTILKISFYCIKYLDKHGYAITKNAVELTKKLGKGANAGFVNAVLRKFISQDIPFPTEKDEFLSVKYSYPIFLVKRLINDYGMDKAVKIMESENKKTTVVFYETDGEKYLTENSVKFEKTPFNNVFSCENFKRNKDYDKGIYTFQALGSVAISDGVKDAENLLDCCSAPGGKSIRLSKRVKQVVSWDIHEHRTALIEEYKRRMNVQNITVQTKDAKILDETKEKSFDAVLVDAPCSGTGVINDNPDIKLNREEDSVKNLNAEQIKILNTVCKYVKTGGYLYYSTCSVLFDENVRIVKKFLSENKDFEIEKAESPLSHLDIEGTLQFTPDEIGGGFYFAKMKRVR